MYEPELLENEERTIELTDLTIDQANIQLSETEELQFSPLAILDEILVEEISIDGMCGIY
jgi:mycofactocin precursor